MAQTTRRDFLATVGAGAAALALRGPAEGAEAPARPNILFIITDQQSATMVGCAGNEHLETPALDRLAARGVRFERAYAANPVCLPSRFSFFTGRMPSSVRIGRNADGRKGVPQEVPGAAMGRLFREAGYETVYGGKVHLPRGMGIEQIGFRPLSRDRRGGLAEACARFLRQPHRRPFLLVASFINPHDICYMAINDYRRTQGQKPIGNQDSRICEGLLREPRRDLEAFVPRHCPPLPPNHPVPELEPEAITKQYLHARSFRRYARERWSPQMWRLHRWAYARLTEMVDAHVGTVLDALREAGLEDDTLVVFTSDHGDHDAAHKLEHKSILYEQAARIPLLVAGHGVARPGRADTDHLVSNGLDLLPTLCDAAGIEPPQGLHGHSLKPLLEGKSPEAWRDHLVVETKCGRMLRTDRHKYCVYDAGEHREQLTDLEADPGEMHNLAYQAEHRATLDRHRELLADWVRRTADPIAPDYIVPPGRTKG
ncbi:MAG: sulfatase [Candidatus Brocadiia bacterium]